MTATAERPPAKPPRRAPRASGGTTGARRAGATGRWDRLAPAGVTAVALVLDAWRLDPNGLGNQCYAAAARSMGGSWSNFFFVAFDPGGYLSVATGQVRFVLVAGGGTFTGGGPGAGAGGGTFGRGGPGGTGRPGGTGSAAVVIAAAAEAGPAVTDAPAGREGALVDCAGRADALRARG